MAWGQGSTKQNKSTESKSSSGKSNRSNRRGRGERTPTRVAEKMDEMMARLDVVAHIHALQEGSVDFGQVGDDNALDRGGSMNHNERGLVMWLEANVVDERERKRRYDRYIRVKGRLKEVLSPRNCAMGVAQVAHNCMSPEVMYAGAVLKPVGLVDGIVDTAAQVVATFMNSLDEVIGNKKAKLSDYFPLRCGQLAADEDDLGG